MPIYFDVCTKIDVGSNSNQLVEAILVHVFHNKYDCGKNAAIGTTTLALLHGAVSEEFMLALLHSD